MSGSEKKQTRTRMTVPPKNIKRVTRKFLVVSRSSRAEKRQRNVQKKCAARVKFLFLLVRPTVVPGELDHLSFHNLCVDMHVNKTKFERNSSLEYYHMTCIAKEVYRLLSLSGHFVSGNLKIFVYARLASFSLRG